MKDISDRVQWVLWDLQDSSSVGPVKVDLAFRWHIHVACKVYPVEMIQVRVAVETLCSSWCLFCLPWLCSVNEIV